MDIISELAPDEHVHLSEERYYGRKSPIHHFLKE